MSDAVDTAAAAVEDLKQQIPQPGSTSEYDKLKKEAEGYADGAVKKGKAVAEELKKELGELEAEGKSLWNKFVESVQASASKISKVLGDAGAQVQSTTCTAVTATSKELQNPVVLAQALVGAGGIFGGYLLYTERHRIDTDNKVVLGLHAAIITGFILVDGYLFNQYYSKYDKK
ncbi:hypothetical protein PICST_75104 [Scheffersomyces stipitis CBS 6054]|uniref:Mitochondrial outer membrane protein OM14 C-terminal domain-containing protein n=1 Tax=Scheffersomyces stipitis (strain ATCC 58785 / CBS 6054 / NBRC 10063 / NRRL Y-11545) TaxID=322104 RepID=A3GFH4_PICST|nr:hypothetical protein PICST_75104 [Scheffersomyces stipitis CBS 6054]EAZ63758.2 hypothetical protein PICST_75104 [Scheffersomyces stipitis CBS 6054]KAG2731486.1 hypothetical protein G9P44_005073 [Scheffersomyces stipitis]